jgi:1,4-alpha-glucan branching enzyme
VKGAIAITMALVLLVGCAYLAPRERAAAPTVNGDGAVVFTYYAPSATRVQLAGDWPGNNWARGDGSAGEADIGLMTDDGNGLWTIAVALEPGRYRYLFWVDEARWHLDPGNPEEVIGGPAGRSSLLTLFRRGGRLELR